MNELFTCGMFCENRNCWYTWWETLEIKEMINIRCQRCHYKSKIAFMTKY